MYEDEVSKFVWNICIKIAFQGTVELRLIKNLHFSSRAFISKNDFQE